jgi:outer membrane protein assembly factor BamB
MRTPPTPSRVSPVPLVWAAIALTACSESSAGPGGKPLTQTPTAPRDTISVVSWRRSRVAVASGYNRADARTLSAILSREVSGISAINPKTGATRWTTSFPSAPTDVRARGTVIRVAYTPTGGTPTEAFLDEATGSVLWSQSTSQLPGRRLVAASPNTILEQLGDTAFVARERSTGQIRWIRAAAVGACSSAAEDCLRATDETQSPFRLVRSLLFGVGLRPFTVTVTDAGVVSASSISDPFSPAFTIVDDFRADSSGTRIFISTLFSAMTLDAGTGEVRWSAQHPLLIDGSALEVPRLSTARGQPALVDLFYRYETPTTTAFARETVRDMASGTIVRETTRKERVDEVAYIGQCGDDGIVIVRTTGRFLFSNIRTGVDTEGIIRDQDTNALTTLAYFDSEASSFAEGYLVFLTNGGLMGFRCHP